MKHPFDDPIHVNQSNFDPEPMEEVKYQDPSHFMETETCHRCLTPFTQEEEAKGEKIMLIDTNCFHTIKK